MRRDGSDARTGYYKMTVPGKHIPNGGFEKSPKTIDIFSGFHELEATAKSERSRVRVCSIRRSNV